MNTDYRRFVLKMLLAWLLVSALTIIAGQYLLAPLLPLLKAILQFMAPEMLPRLSLEAAAGGGILQLEVWVMAAIRLTVGVVIPKGVILKSSTHIVHVLLPVSLLIALLLVWPLHTLRDRLILLGLGMAAAVLILLATIPALLLGVLEMQFQEAAQNARPDYQPPWFMDWMIFCEMGGSFLLAAIAGYLCIRYSRGTLKNQALVLRQAQHERVEH